MVSEPFRAYPSEYLSPWNNDYNILIAIITMINNISLEINNILANYVNGWVFIIPSLHVGS